MNRLNKVLKTTLFLTATTLLLASCVSNKVNMMPNSKIVYNPGDKLVITRLENVKTYRANDLYEETFEKFDPHPGIDLIDESDFIYNMKQKGIELPTYDLATKEQLFEIYSETGMDFILVSKMLSKTDQIHSSTKGIPGLEELSPTREAVLSFKLYDLNVGIATVVLDIKTTISPLSWYDKNGGYHNFNPSSSDGALTKAYKKSTKKFYDSFICCE